MAPSSLATIALLLGPCAPLAHGASRQSCHSEFVELPARPLSAGGFAIDLGEADSADAPTAWQGPVKIAGHGSACHVPDAVSLIEAPMVSDGRHLLVTTFSGSLVTLDTVDMPTCRILWQSRPLDEASAVLRA